MYKACIPEGDLRDIRMRLLERQELLIRAAVGQEEAQHERRRATGAEI